MSLIIKKNTTFKIPRTPFLPSSLGGLALWLKADAGVTRSSINSVTQIEISGTSIYNGTYGFTSDFRADFDGDGVDEVIERYYSGPNGYTLVYYADGRLELAGLAYSSYDNGVTWYDQNLNVDDDVSSVFTFSTVYTDNVTAWADQSGNGNNATPVANNPIYNISDLNSKPTISLTSMSDYVERVFSISINPLGVAGSTAFSVQYVEDVCDAGDDNGPIFGNFGGSEDSASLSQTHYPYGPDCFVYDAFGTRLRKDQITSPVTIANAWTLYSVKSTDNDWQSFVNGQLMHSDPTNTYSSAVGGDDTTLYIGKQTANGTYSLKGKVAEVVVYNRVLTISERQQVETYLNSKYAIY
jgi:hypothetical protein